MNRIVVFSHPGMRLAQVGPTTFMWRQLSCSWLCGFRTAGGSESHPPTLSNLFQFHVLVVDVLDTMTINYSYHIFYPSFAARLLISIQSQLKQWTNNQNSNKSTCEQKRLFCASANFNLHLQMAGAAKGYIFVDQFWTISFVEPMYFFLYFGKVCFDSAFETQLYDVI